MLLHIPIPVSYTHLRSTDEFFEVMSKKAVDLGYVTEQFLSAIKKREQDYPTALPVKPYPVAIPHSDPCLLYTSVSKSQ